MDFLYVQLDFTIYQNMTNPPRNWRGIVRENIGERTGLSGCHQVMDA